jgi:hypothetical protein
MQNCINQMNNKAPQVWSTAVSRESILHRDTMKTQMIPKGHDMVSDNAVPKFTLVFSWAGKMLDSRIHTLFPPHFHLAVTIMKNACDVFLPFYHVSRSITLSSLPYVVNFNFRQALPKCIRAGPQFLPSLKFISVLFMERNAFKRITKSAVHP